MNKPKDDDDGPRRRDDRREEGGSWRDRPARGDERRGDDRGGGNWRDRDDDRDRRGGKGDRDDDRDRKGGKGDRSAREDEGTRSGGSAPWRRPQREERDEEKTWRRDEDAPRQQAPRDRNRDAERDE